MSLNYLSSKTTSTWLDPTLGIVTAKAFKLLDPPSAGEIGEFQSTATNGTKITLTNGVANNNEFALALTAGTWTGTCQISLFAGADKVEQAVFGLSADQTDGSFSDEVAGLNTASLIEIPKDTAISCSIPAFRFTLTSPSQLLIKADASFSGVAPQIECSITATRIV